MIKGNVGVNEINASPLVYVIHGGEYLLEARSEASLTVNKCRSTIQLINGMFHVWNRHVFTPLQRNTI